MIFRVRIAAIAFLLGTTVAFAAEPTSSPSPPPLSALPADQLAKAIKTDALTIPTPGELFAALKNRGNLTGPVNIARRFP